MSNPLFVPPGGNPFELVLTLSISVTSHDDGLVVDEVTSDPPFNSDIGWQPFLVGLEQDNDFEMPTGTYVFTVSRDGVQVEDMPTGIGEDGRRKLVEGIDSRFGGILEALKVALVRWPTERTFAAFGVELATQVAACTTESALRDGVKANHDAPIRFVPAKLGDLVQNPKVTRVMDTPIGPAGAMLLLEFGDVKMAMVCEDDGSHTFHVTGTGFYSDWLSASMAEQLDLAVANGRAAGIEKSNARVQAEIERLQAALG